MNQINMFFTKFKFYYFPISTTIYTIIFSIYFFEKIITDCYPFRPYAVIEDFFM